MRADDVRVALREVAEPERAPLLARYFQAFPGGYGEGDVFLGCRVPACRAVARRHRSLGRRGVVSLLHSRVHEERLVALLIAVDQFRRGGEAERCEIVDLYLANTRFVNNWDLVDLSSPRILGAWLLGHPRDILDRLAGSELVWERRIAVLATFVFIRAGDCEDSLRLATRLLSDEHDLIHKAVGWMLREVGEQDEAALIAFLDDHAMRMPRTMLRDAVERLETAERARLMALR